MLSDISLSARTAGKVLVSPSRWRRSEGSGMVETAAREEADRARRPAGGSLRGLGVLLEDRAHVDALALVALHIVLGDERLRGRDHARQVLLGHDTERGFERDLAGQDREAVDRARQVAGPD